jgi:DNA-binding transcriptional LysR family regulator
MDLKQLEYFVRVAELGSFTRAAVVLDVAQPALSRQVRLLEVELRQNLLTRNGRGAAPTEAGKLLLEHGRGILHQVERAREELGRVRGALAGRVALEIDGVAAILDRVADGAGSAILSRNAVATSARPQAFAIRPIGTPALRSKLALARSSQRPATLTQKAMSELIARSAQALLAGG